MGVEYFTRRLETAPIMEILEKGKRSCETGAVTNEALWRRRGERLAQAGGKVLKQT
jgi:hypothetical protein